MKSFLVLAIVLLHGSISHSQSIGLELFSGITNYQGDLRQRIFTLQGSRPAIGLGASYSMNGHLAVRVALKNGTLGADDRLNKDSAIYYRNLSFQTGITDVEAVVLYRVLEEEKSRYNLYVYAGVSGFRFNPYAYDQFGVKRFLQPLGTEGQGLPGYPRQNPYRLTEFAIPLGLGLEFRIAGGLMLAWEFTFRKTFTDYLDDVSTNYADEFDLLFGRGPAAADLSYRGDEMLLINPNVPFTMPKGAKRGNPGAMDLYYFTGLNLRYLLGRSKDGAGFGGSKSRKGTACPKW